MAGNFGSPQNPTSQIYMGDGSAAAPSFTFGADTDVGLYRSNTNEISISTAGVLRWSIDGNGTMYAGTSQGIQFPVGSASVPAFNFTNDTNTGIFWRSADSFGFSANGVLRATLNTTGFSVDSGTLQLLDGTAGAPTHTFGADSDTGMYRVSSNVIGFATGGVERLEITVANSANDIQLSVFDFTFGGLKAVTRGAADSGGAGFRVLRIAN